MTAANVTQVRTFTSDTISVSTQKQPNADEFSKIFEKSTETDNQSQSVTKKDDVSAKSVDEKSPETEKTNAGEKTDTAKPEKKTDKTSLDDDKKDIETEITEPDAKTIEAMAGLLNDKAQEMMQQVEDVLDVSKEQILDAMDSLGMKMTDLLDPASMQKLAIALTDGADELSLMTEEKLFSDVKELTDKAEKMLSELADVLGTDTKSILQSIKEAIPVQQTLNDVQVDMKLLTDEESVIFATEKETIPVAPKENQGTDTHSDETRGNENQTLNLTQTVLKQLESAINKVNQTQDTAFASDPTEIMNQITEALKLTMKDDTTEMEMQLHPASLGNVRVQVAAKDGVITASFTTQNEAVKAAIESQLLTLKDSMNEQGIKVEAVEVTVASHAFERNLSDEGNDSGEGRQTEGKKKGIRRINLADLTDDSEESILEEDKIVADMMKKNGNTVDYTA